MLSTITLVAGDGSGRLMLHPGFYSDAFLTLQEAHIANAGGHVQNLDHLVTRYNHSLKGAEQGSIRNKTPCMPDESSVSCFLHSPFTICLANADSVPDDIDWN